MENAQTRKKIRKAVVALLTGRTKVGDEVEDSRAAKLFAQSKPTILIYARDEASSVVTITSRQRRRVLRLAIEIRHQAVKGLDDYLDEVSEEVEQIMKENSNLSGTAQSNALTETLIDVEQNGDKPIGAARLTYDLIYFN